MTMGERIKQLRSAKGFTQEMLAEKMNVSRSAIANWEKTYYVCFTSQRKETYDTLY